MRVHNSSLTFSPIGHNQKVGRTIVRKIKTKMNYPPSQKTLKTKNLISLLHLKRLKKHWIMLA